MKKRSFKYKKALGITLALAVFLGGIGVVQRILDNHTSDFEDESVVKDDDAAKQEQSLILFEGVYRPNQGIDYSNKNEAFDILAAISGTVTKKTNDPVLGWIVTITNGDKISTTYESLSKVSVELNQTVKQGDVIGTSGENVYEADLKNHLHFILQKEDQLLTPEKYLGQALNTIK